MNESWRPVPGFEALYLVSDLGRVRSARSGRVLVGDGTRHLRVTLSRAGRTTRLLVHRLVLEAFVGPCPPGMESLHENDIGADNRLANLRWGTRSENELEKVRNGNNPEARKTHCVNGHEFTAANTYKYRGKDGKGRARRMCRTCLRERQAKRRASATEPIVIDGQWPMQAWTGGAA